jgi:molybdopterin-synthase adenylyltransferase
MPTLARTAHIQSRARLAGYDPDVIAGGCVAIVGAGALGQNLALDLALTGIGELRLIDGDTFEDHNRSRSPMHPRRGTYTPDETLPKAATVARELAAVHIDRQALIRYADVWVEDLGFGAFAGVDVIAACVDSLTARAYLAWTAMLLGIPVVDGGFSGANLGMSVYPVSERPQFDPCWSCAGTSLPGAFSCQQYAAYAESAGVVPAIQNGAAALAAICAEALVEVLHGRRTEPHRVAFDLRSGTSSAFRPSPDPVCARAHRRLPAPVACEVQPSDRVQTLLGRFGPGAALSLREVFIERANCPAPGCGVTCEVGAPAQRWQRDPRCEACGGHWPRSQVQIPSPDTIEAAVRSDAPHASVPLAALGYRAGDILELDGAAEPTVRLAGGPADLYACAGA